MSLQLQPLDAEELQQLGLQRDPFVDEAEGLLFHGGERSDIAEQLQHLARYSDAILLVTGVDGSGSTMLRRFFVANADDDVAVCEIEAHFLGDAAALEADIAAGFGLETSSSREEILHFLSVGKNHGRLNWLGVDDADELSETALDSLIALANQGGEHLHLVLFGSQRLEDQLRYRVEEGSLQVFELPPLSREESKEYVNYRLQVAGIGDAELFSEEELDMIAARGRGLPLQIHNLAYDVLRKQIAGLSTRQTSLPKMHIALIMVTFLLLLFLYLFNQDADDRDKSGSRPTAGLNGGQRIDVLTEVLQSEATAESPSPATVQPTLDDVTPVEEARQPATIVEDSAPPTDAPVIESPAAEPQKAEQQEADFEPAQTVETPSPSVEESVPSEALSAEEKLLLRVSDTSYFLQLMAGVDKSGIAAFRAGLPVPATIYRRMRQGKLWYVVVAGPYPDMEAAGEARDALPKSIRDASPWRRPASQVKEEIRQFAASN